MDRKSKIFYSLDRKGFGLEIGPSHSPIAPKIAGFNVRIQDHLSAEALIQKYTGHGVCLQNIEHVDYIWNGEPFAELVGREHVFDWIIASHVIEHTPCLITFIKNCEAVLKERGVLSLAIPDKRYCFDFYREKTSLSSVLDAFRERRQIHTPGTAAEYYLNVASKNGNIAWSQEAEGEAGLMHELIDAKRAMERIENEHAFLDLHSWVFTPYSFRLMIEDLYQLGYIRFREMCFFDTEGCEFYITLGAHGSGPAHTRFELVKLNARQV
jgi:predicted SAM-dependent methyltransferase